MRCYTEIDGIQVDSKIFTAMFSCDYEKCEGACCSQPIPDVELNGGELTDHEAANILFHKEELSPLCSRDDRPIVKQAPLYKDGEVFYTTLIGHRCVFCNLDKRTCSLKIAREKEISDIDIPLSCQLYPILWEVFPDCEKLSIGHTFDSYCVYGYTKGKTEKIYLLDFLKTPLIRAFGEEFFIKLKAVQKEFI